MPIKTLKLHFWIIYYTLQVLSQTLNLPNSIRTIVQNMFSFLRMHKTSYLHEYRYEMTQTFSRFSVSITYITCNLHTVYNSFCNVLFSVSEQVIGKLHINLEEIT